MNIKIFYLLLILGAFGFNSFAKKPLDHDAFDSWKKVANHSISNNGQWFSYSEIPQEGDAILYFRNLKTGKTIKIERGSDAAFSADSKWAFAKIKPFYKDSRQAKIDGKKDLKAPQDSLAIVNLETAVIEKIPNVKSYKLGEKNGSWIAFQSVDTLYAETKDLNDKKAGKPLIVRNFDGSIHKVVKWVDNYVFSKEGNRLALTVKKPDSDSITTNGVGLMMFPDTAFYLIDRDQKFYGVPVFDESGKQLAYTAGNDSSESGTKKLKLFLSDLTKPMNSPKVYDIVVPASKGKHIQRPNPNYPDLKGEKLREWERRMASTKIDSLFINQYSEPTFSYNGKRLIIGVAPYIAPDDTTIVDFERADLDIWRWDAPYTPPQEKSNLSLFKKNQCPIVINLASDDWILTTHSLFAEVSAPNRWDSDWALVSDPAEFMVQRQWDYLAPEEVSLVNISNGTKRYIGTMQHENFMLSPDDKYVIWYADRNFYTYGIATGDTVCISKGIPYPIWNEEDDHPMEKQAYGITGWAENDEWVFINDQFDIWGVDPSGIKPSFCLTNGEGRKTDRVYSYRKTDQEQRFIKKGDLLLFNVFDKKTKENGLATIKYEGKAKTPDLRIFEGASFTQIKKAKNADSFSWQRASFEILPNIWGVTSLNFSRALQLTDANPQAKDYSWGTAQLFKWNAYDGKPSEGVLYLPEDFSPEKEYPMLSVFYETGSQDLYYHYAMEPSWSWVNYPFYVSRGYVVFVPDIHYTPGLPGESAYNYVCSGVEAVCELYPNIDKKRLGIDGQSWGGYQTAYLVTRTNMFACAGSGAPVANMTSAFGGIRWESGSSRQAQYEQGQSRIGGTLWENRDLYIKNSPVFFADKCNTPLLIMHNDADGAVPWYQGIELFMALRRLQKPVWMLQYNGEAHNIKERKNRKDITIRLQQFFDHYLMGEPMPRWMREGINPLRKGQEMGY